ncbi:hypothetical protein PM082_002034 [Marasmius tenuissimus]|nr:hypothetical protein PM082_002034 [Marasmius tenuissimus]
MTMSGAKFGMLTARTLHLLTSLACSVMNHLYSKVISRPTQIIVNVGTSPFLIKVPGISKQNHFSLSVVGRLAAETLCSTISDQARNSDLRLLTLEWSSVRGEPP